MWRSIAPLSLPQSIEFVVTVFSQFPWTDSHQKQPVAETPVAEYGRATDSP